MDGIEVSFRDFSLTWAGYHSEILITLMEHDWKYENLIVALTERWEKESFHAVTKLSQEAPPAIINNMQKMIRMFIIEQVNNFRRAR